MVVKNLVVYDNSHLFYETGLPCSKGHVSKRYVSTYQCFECQEKYRILNRRKYKLNQYGMSEKDYDELLKNQNYVCAICKEPETTIDGQTQETKVLSVDHCHSSNKVRGLLCNNCNQGLGKFKDNISKLQLAIDYLKKNDPWK